MYNLSVAVAQTYYVGEGQWLVHNTNCFLGYSAMQKSLKNTGYQANHLNQDAAFSHDGAGRSIIPSKDGVAIPLYGDAFNDVGSEHFIFHAHLENFWDQYRQGGALAGRRPMLDTYNAAVENALRSAGIPEKEIQMSLNAMRGQQAQYASQLNGMVPRVPGRIYQNGR